MNSSTSSGSISRFLGPSSTTSSTPLRLIPLAAVLLSVVTRGWHQSSLDSVPQSQIDNPEFRHLDCDMLALLTRARHTLSTVRIASVTLLVPQQTPSIKIVAQNARAPRCMPPDRRIAPGLAARSLDAFAIEVSR